MRETKKKILVLSAVLVLIAAACGGSGSDDGGGGGPSTDSASGGEPQVGGTLRLGMNTDVCNQFDPQKAYCSINWEFQRIMTRTLLTNNGLTAVEGGTTMVPDLAADMPEISDDGLTWTFKIKDGIKYAPPLEATNVTSGDFVRAIMRESDPEASRGGYAGYYSVIEGFDEFGAGKADSITGLATPDDQTLVVTLKEKSGDFGYRVAMAATSPIPPNPDAPDAPLGIAEGHTKDFGRFQVATGPYMFEGSETMTFSGEAKDHTPAPGYEPGRSISLVRNPSYDPATDGNRPAYVDAITVEIGATVEDIAAKVDAGELDNGFDASYTPEQLQSYTADPELADQVNITPSSATSYVVLNLAQEPFDDIHVRKAVNLVIDKEAARRVVGGAALGDIANHIMPNGLTGGLLTDYDPYPSTDSRGDVEAAMAEMKLSAYDSNQDGICDAPECEGILAVADQGDPAPKRVAVIEDSLKKIGITMDTKYASFSAMYERCEDPTAKIAMCPTLAWAQDYPDAYTFAPPLFGKEAITSTNIGLVGADPDQLAEWGYNVTSVPSAEDKMTECAALEGDPRVECYAELDKYLMEEVVPWVPLRFANQVDIVSKNVTHYQEDAWADVMSLDHVAVSSGTA